MTHGDHISVVMPVHNALPHLDAAVRSILDQTHADFEFVIFDDASTDGSAARLRKWAARDSRIRLLEGQENLGPVGSSSLVVEQAKAPLIARMDADDVCDPDRLRRQVQVLSENSDAGVVASLFGVIDERGRALRGPEVWRLARKSPFVPFAHGSIMFRRSIFDQVGGYRAQCEYWEDQDLDRPNGVSSRRADHPGSALPGPPVDQEHASLPRTVSGSRMPSTSCTGRLPGWNRTGVTTTCCKGRSSRAPGLTREFSSPAARSFFGRAGDRDYSPGCCDGVG